MGGNKGRGKGRDKGRTGKESVQQIEGGKVRGREGKWQLMVRERKSGRSSDS